MFKKSLSKLKEKDRWGVLLLFFGDKGFRIVTLFSESHIL